MTAHRSGRLHLSGLPARLTPHEVRTHAFDARRRGVAPDQVRDFQARVADDLTELQRRVRLLAQENDRLKRALRDWQAMHARECRPPNDGHW
ncbi:DivIVA domain-containing protein [Micromonospora chalcea]|uniref:DivIVA domain-containing protein n=1 Tax=Micromonospora chalcea TaxID=1874 RepID=UPI003790FBA2